MTQQNKYWVTKRGIVVYMADGPTWGMRPTDKVHMYRAATGGYHGLLRVDKLREATRAEIDRALDEREERSDKLQEQQRAEENRAESHYVAGYVEAINRINKCCTPDRRSLR